LKHAFSATPGGHLKADSGGIMKKIGVLVLLVSTLAVAQDTGSEQSAAPAAKVAKVGEAVAVTHPVEAIQKPTYEDIHCAGFVTRDAVSRSSFVAGGLTSPDTTKFVKDDVVYLSGGHWSVGDRVTFVRELLDPNRYEPFAGQHALLAATGQPYTELGEGKVVDTRSKMAIALVNFSCEPIVPGDQVTSFIERPEITFRSPQQFDRFAPRSASLIGRIVLAHDFDEVLGTGSKVYLTVGSNKGVKAGDYFRVTRTYAADLIDPMESQSFKASTTEDTQKNPPTVGSHWGHGKGPVIQVQDMPRHAIGELIVLHASPTSATGMITFALEDIRVGDDVEAESSAPTTASAQ
jgi:hypothetical protein